jgi:hypothetical protein
MKRLMKWGVFAAVLSSGVALAQDDYQPMVDDREVKVEIENKNEDRGPYVLLGGGVEGYTGLLAPNINPGVTYSVEAGIRPIPGLAFELGYNGGLHDIDTGPGGVRDGADVVRNAGQAVMVVNAPLGNAHPYLLGGIGVEGHNVRALEGTSAARGFTDDTSGYVPTGVGLRLDLTDTIAADLRGTYNFPLSQDFAPFDTGAGSGRYQGLLQLGGAF